MEAHFNTFTSLTTPLLTPEEWNKVVPTTTTYRGDVAVDVPVAFHFIPGAMHLLQCNNTNHEINVLKVAQKSSLSRLTPTTYSGF